MPISKKIFAKNFHWASLTFFLTVAITAYFLEFLKKRVLVAVSVFLSHCLPLVYLAIRWIFIHVCVKNFLFRFLSFMNCGKEVFLQLLLEPCKDFFWAYRCENSKNSLIHNDCHLIFFNLYQSFNNLKKNGGILVNLCPILNLSYTPQDPNMVIRQIWFFIWLFFKRPLSKFYFCQSILKTILRHIQWMHSLISKTRNPPGPYQQNINRYFLT